MVDNPPGDSSSMNLCIAVMTIRSANPARLGDFYSHVLGLRALRREEMYVVLDCRGVSLEISYGQASGSQELKFEVHGMDEAVATLKGRGAVFEEIEIGMRADGTIAKGTIGETFWGRYALLRDTDGNSIALEEHDEQLFPFMPAWFTSSGEDDRQTDA